MPPSITMRSVHWGRFRGWLSRPVPALPLDLFRVAVGALSLAYFVRLLLETPEFSSPDGLLDHGFLARVLWFTRWSLFQPGMPEWVFHLAYAVGGLASVAIAVGVRPRTAGVVAFVIATSQSRWNFPVFSVDDSIVHLCLLWIVLLPVGRTVTVGEWRERGRGAWRRWALEDVPGATVRLFVANVCLVYLTAGLSKLFFSEYWRDGFALYAILRQPIAYFPEWWGPAQVPILRVATWLSLATELALPWLLTRRAGSRWKILGAVLLIAFHLGIIATIRVPFANVALIATLPLFFREELVARIRGPAWRVPHPSPRRLVLAERLALGLVVVLALAMLRRTPVIGAIHRPAFAALWAVGLAQDYHLFDWVDGLSYHVRPTIRIRRPGGVRAELPVTELYPATMRHVLLQVYLHDFPWMTFPRRERQAFRDAIAVRTAGRYCLRENPAAEVVLWTTVQRIEPRNVALDRGREQRVLAFACAGAQGEMFADRPPMVQTYRVRRRW